MTEKTSLSDKEQMTSIEERILKNQVAFMKGIFHKVALPELYRGINETVSMLPPDVFYGAMDGWTGEYDDTREYSPRDVIQFKRLIYECKHTCKGIEPPNKRYWEGGF